MKSKARKSRKLERVGFGRTGGFFRDVLEVGGHLDDVLGVGVFLELFVEIGFGTDVLGHVAGAITFFRGFPEGVGFLDVGGETLREGTTSSAGGDGVVEGVELLFSKGRGDSTLKGSFFLGGEVDGDALDEIIVGFGDNFFAVLGDGLLLGVGKVRHGDGDNFTNLREEGVGENVS